MAEKRKRGRPATGNDPDKLTALQGHLLAEAGRAGVPIDPAKAREIAGSLAKLSGRDLQAIPVLADSPAALEAMARLLEDDPDAFLRHYENLLEFTRPKLARVEHKHEGQIGHQVFVPVERREVGPPPPLEGKVVSEQ